MSKIPTFATFPQYLYNMGVGVHRVNGNLVFRYEGDNKTLPNTTIYTMAKDYQAFKLIFEALHSHYDKGNQYTEKVMLDLYADIFGFNLKVEGYTTDTKNGLPVFRDSAGTILPYFLVRHRQNKIIKARKALHKKTFFQKILHRLGLREDEEL